MSYLTSMIFFIFPSELLTNKIVPSSPPCSPPSFSQVNNGYILVVIHVSTSSQTIKVSIDDTPSQVDKYST